MPPPIGVTTLLLCFFVNAALGQSGQKYATGANNLSATDKLGSKNYAPVRIVTNNIERARFTGDGLFGLGTATPTATFDLSGSFRYRNGSQQPGFFLATDANGNASWQQVPFSSHWTLNGNDLSYTLGAVSIGTDVPLGTFTVAGPSYFAGDVAVNGVLSVIKLVNADTIGVGPGTPSTTFEVFGDGKISGNLETGSFSTQKITTLRITSPDSVLRIGDSSIVFVHAQNRIEPSLTQLNAPFQGLGFGKNTFGKGFNSTAIGSEVESSVPGAIVIGRGISNANRLVNNRPNTLMVSFNSDIATFFVGSASGAGTTGNVGIGVSTNLQNKLEVAGGVVIGSAFAGQGNTLVPNGMRVEGLTSIGIPDQDNLNVRLVLEGQLKLNADRTIINGFNGGDNHWIRTSQISTDALFMAFNGTPNGAANSVNIAPRGGTGLTVVHDVSSGRKLVGIGTAFPAFELDAVGNVRISKDDNDQKGNLTVCGEIFTTRVIVDVNTCDFVFEKNYKGLSYEKKNRYHLTYKHLRGVQSQAEVDRDGFDMGRNLSGVIMNVEENAIGIFDQYQRNNKQDLEIKQLKEENHTLAVECIRLSEEYQKLERRLVDLEKK